MPDTTVQKITGAMIILISLMKPSPSGFMATPPSGRTYRAARRRNREQHLHVQDFIKGFFTGSPRIVFRVRSASSLSRADITIVESRK
jgi:hypothetical protein